MRRMTRQCLLLILCFYLAGCEQQPPAADEPDAMAEPLGEALLKAQWRLPANGRIVAIGDLHGDLEATLKALRLAGAIDDRQHWAGGTLTLVQTGDLLDRGDQERQVIDLFRRLQVEATAAGGRVILMLGNHEVMNAQADFRYVTPKGYRGWDRLRSRSRFADNVIDFRRGRAAAFLPGGEYARLFGTWNAIVIVGDTVFAHAGVLPKHVEAGIDQFNRETGAWLRGESPVPVGAFSIDAPFWTRQYGALDLSPETCALLGDVLGRLGAQRMVVAHTVQPQGINAACDERLYRIDVGLAAFYGNGPVQVLQIEDGQVTVLRLGNRDSPAVSR